MGLRFFWAIETPKKNVLQKHQYRRVFAPGAAYHTFFLTHPVDLEAILYYVYFPP